jgi:hypothetical protein
MLARSMILVAACSAGCAHRAHEPEPSRGENQEARPADAPAQRDPAVGREQRQPQAPRDGMPMTKNELTARFNALADEWVKHCNQRHVMFSASHQDDLDCRAYRELCRLGKPAVPLIMERYKKQAEAVVETDFLFWEYLLDEITGLRMVDPDGYDVRDVQRRYLEWWEKHKASWSENSGTTIDRGKTRTDGESAGQK